MSRQVAVFEAKDRTGTVLRFSHVDRTAPLRAISLLELFQDIAQGLQTGKYGYSNSKGVY